MPVTDRQMISGGIGAAPAALPLIINEMIFNRKGLKMETRFIYLKEGTKFWIVSTVVGLAILILVFLSGSQTGYYASYENPDSVGNKYFSEILGVNPTGDHGSWNIRSADIFESDIWQMGESAYAANFK